MTLNTKLPTGDLTDVYDARSPTKVSGSTFYGILSDASNTSYLQYTTGGSSVGILIDFADISLAAGEFVRRVRINMRLLSSTGNPDMYAFFMDDAGRRTTVEDHYTTDTGASWVDVVGAWHTVGPDGLPWSAASFASAKVRVVDTDLGSTKFQLAELVVQAETNFIPTVTPQSNVVVTDTTRPVFNWAYYDADGDPQQAFTLSVNMG